MFFNDLAAFDNAALERLDIDAVKSYLLVSGWREYRILETGVSIWDREKDNYLNRIRLPGGKDFDDYAKSLRIALQTVANLENRPFGDIFESLLSRAVGDIIRLTTYDRFDRESFSIPLLDGVSLIDKARRLATAAALSAETLKASFSNFRSIRVQEYLARVRLGQTEAGSYRIKLLTPLPDVALLPLPGVMPYERRVSQTLASGLEALEYISRSIAQRGDYQFEQFLEAVDNGVSANLCEALVDSKPREYSLPLEIAVEWSPAFTGEVKTTTAIEFTPDVLAYVQQAAKDFRDSAPQVVRLSGLVTALANNPRKTNLPPKISMTTNVDAKQRTVHIAFDRPEDYLIAVDAHRNQQEFLVSGILRQVGRSTTLDEPHDLVSIPRAN